MGRIVIFLLSILWPTATMSDMADNFRGMEGWTVAAVTQVDGEFEGCDFDKKITFLNGMILECATYDYFYAFMPTAVIFVNVTTYNQSEYYRVKVLVNDEIMDMLPILK